MNRYRLQRDEFCCGPIACINALIASGVPAHRAPSIRYLAHPDRMDARERHDSDGFGGTRPERITRQLDVYFGKVTHLTDVRNGVLDSWAHAMKCCDQGAVLVILFSFWTDVPSTPERLTEAIPECKRNRYRKSGTEYVSAHYITLMSTKSKLADEQATAEFASRGYDYVATNVWNGERYSTHPCRNFEVQELVIGPPSLLWKNPQDGWGPYPQVWVVDPRTLRPGLF